MDFKFNNEEQQQPGEFGDIKEGNVPYLDKLYLPEQGVRVVKAVAKILDTCADENENEVSIEFSTLWYE